MTKYSPNTLIIKITFKIKESTWNKTNFQYLSDKNILFPTSLSFSFYFVNLNNAEY